MKTIQDILHLSPLTVQNIWLLADRGGVQFPRNSWPKARASIEYVWKLCEPLCSHSLIYKFTRNMLKRLCGAPEITYWLQLCANTYRPRKRDLYVLAMQAINFQVALATWDELAEDDKTHLRTQRIQDWDCVMPHFSTEQFKIYKCGYRCHPESAFVFYRQLVRLFPQLTMASFGELARQHALLR